MKLNAMLKHLLRIRVDVKMIFPQNEPFLLDSELKSKLWSALTPELVLTGAVWAAAASISFWMSDRLISGELFSVFVRLI